VLLPPRGAALVFPPMAADRFVRRMMDASRGEALRPCKRSSIPTKSGIRAAAVRSSEVVGMNGTSVAAPVVARRLFNLMKTEKVQRDKMAKALIDLVKEYPEVLSRPQAAEEIPEAAPPTPTAA
jgi:hypothetical protein